METIKNKIPDDVRQFLNNLKHYLELPIYYHGSCQRLDYIEGSDIDMCIFTHNESSTITKLVNYFEINKKKVYKTVHYINNEKLVFGNKINYYKLSIPLELIVYNIKDKPYMLQHCISNIQIPIYISTLLLIVKYFYYKFKILDYTTYTNIKNKLIFYAMGKHEGIFIKI